MAQEIRNVVARNHAALVAAKHPEQNHSKPNRDQVLAVYASLQDVSKSRAKYVTFMKSYVDAVDEKRSDDVIKLRRKVLQTAAEDLIKNLDQLSARFNPIELKFYDDTEVNQSLSGYQQVQQAKAVEVETPAFIETLSSNELHELREQVESNGRLLEKSLNVLRNYIRRAFPEDF